MKRIVGVKWTLDEPCPVLRGDRPIVKDEVITGPDYFLESLAQRPGFEIITEEPKGTPIKKGGQE